MSMPTDDAAICTGYRPLSDVSPKNGNLTDDGELYLYVYDVFNRLVQVTNRSTSAVVAKYAYNALNQRISEQYDCNDSSNSGKTDGATDSYDPVFFIANDRMGRRVATFRSTDTHPKETFIYHANGSSQGYGPGLPGGVMLRDRDAPCAETDKWATTAASSTRAERYFYFPDSKGSIMAMVGADGVLAEQYRYSPTGIPFGIPGGDMDSDGTVNTTFGQPDYTIVKTVSPYQVRKDLDLDGDVDNDDFAFANADSGQSTGRGQLSQSNVNSSWGFNNSDSSTNRDAYIHFEANAVLGQMLARSTQSVNDILENQRKRCSEACSVVRPGSMREACLSGCLNRILPDPPATDGPVQPACITKCDEAYPPPYAKHNEVCKEACRGETSPQPPLIDIDDGKPFKSCEELGQIKERDCNQTYMDSVNALIEDGTCTLASWPPLPGSRCALALARLQVERQSCIGEARDNVKRCLSPK